MTSSELTAAVAAARVRPPVRDLTTHRELAAAAAAASDVTAEVEVAPAPGRPGSELLRPRGREAAGTVLYLHSGGYGAGNPRMCRPFLARLVAATGLAVLVPAYRLAPEHAYPAALDDALAAYADVVDADSAGRTAVGGASAGGGLALATLLAARDQGLPLPAAAFLISPWTDLTLTSPSLRDGSSDDPLNDLDYLELLAGNYAGPGTDRRDPGLSPVLGSFDRMPPVHLEVGSTERLLDDAVRTARALAAAGRSVSLSVVEDALHTFPHSCPGTPEATAAAERISLHLRTHLDIT